MIVLGTTFANFGCRLAVAQVLNQQRAYYIATKNSLKSSVDNNRYVVPVHKAPYIGVSQKLNTSSNPISRGATSSTSHRAMSRRLQNVSNSSLNLMFLKVVARELALSVGGRNHLALTKWRSWRSNQAKALHDPDLPDLARAKLPRCLHHCFPALVKSRQISVQKLRS